MHHTESAAQQLLARVILVQAKSSPLFPITDQGHTIFK